MERGVDRGKREGEKERGIGWMDEGREGGRKGGREGGRDGGREGRTGGLVCSAE